VPTNPEPEDIELPSTLERSGDKAQRTYQKAKASAIDTYDDDGEAVNRVAFAALKHTHEKVGDHWEPKDEPGPSDPQAAKSGDEAIRGEHPTGGGHDVGTTKGELYEQAQKLDVSGRSKMDTDELTEAVSKAKAKAERSS